MREQIGKVPSNELRLLYKEEEQNPHGHSDIVLDEAAGTTHNPPQGLLVQSAVFIFLAVGTLPLLY